MAKRGRPHGAASKENVELLKIYLAKQEQEKKEDADDK